MDDSRLSPGYRKYLLTLLMIILAFNFVDRIALGVTLQDIKLELGLSDTQLGLLSGIAFAIFYSIMGIPIARWADRGNRVTIIALTTGLWSLMVIVCGMAMSFAQLLLIRIGVGVGEAGCIPPAQSLIAEAYSRSQRPRAAAIYTLGGPLSFIVGYFFTGWLNEFYGWRATFMILGMPGIALAVLAWWTLKEPRIAISLPNTSQTARGSANVLNVCSILWQKPTFRHVLIAFAINYFFGYGLMQWQPVFFMRSHGLSSGELGTWLAIAYGAGGLLGTYMGGDWAVRYAAGNERLQFKAMALAVGAAGSLYILVYLASSKYLAFGFLTAAAFINCSIYGPLYGVIQTVAPPRMRATAVAIVLFVANLVGMGFGPLAAGVLSDVLRPTFGEEALRYALAALCPGFLWCMWHMWQASRTVMDDLAEAPGCIEPVLVAKPSGNAA